MRSIWKFQHDQLRIYPSLTRRDPTPSPDCVWFFLSVGVWRGEAVTVPSSVIVSLQPRFPSITGPGKKTLKETIKIVWSVQNLVYFFPMWKLITPRSNRRTQIGCDNLSLKHSKTAGSKCANNSLPLNLN